MPHDDLESFCCTLLGMLLDYHPGQLSFQEIVRILHEGEIRPNSHNDVAVALDDLVGHGLAHRHGDFIFASVAAVRFNELAGPSVKV